MHTAVRWIGVGSVTIAAVFLVASLRGRTVRAEQNPAEILELGRCTDSEIGERLAFQREFDACVAKHSGDILARRHEGDRLVIVASMYTDFSICAHDVACTYARSATDPKARYHRWRLRSDAWFGWAGGVPRVCAIQDAGGIRATIDDAREQATIETEVGTHVDRCMSYDRQSFELAN
jgi:hypothetical protein